MQSDPRLIAVDATNFDALPCCGIRCSTHPGRVEKREWLRANACFGLCAKTLLAPDGRACGYIEYIPGEHAWRGIEARGFMVIHCVWMHSRQHQGQGWGSLMIEDCLAEAQGVGMNGVAVVARQGPWLASRRLFQANRFESVDTAPPDFELLVRKFRSKAANPHFRRNDDDPLASYRHGLTIVRSTQCPYTAKFSSEIAAAAEQEYGLRARIVTLDSPQRAQSAPTPYATFAVIYNGRVLADHQISRTRFRNIMKGVK
jgi:hypothetical protein